MARRAQPLGAGALAGIAVAAVVPALIAVTGAAVILVAEGGRGLSPADWAVIRFTCLQAALSSVISVALAIPLARALARRRFRGRGLLISLFGAPFILPAVVAVFGLLAVFGRGGVLNMALAAAGIPTISIYGLHGVVLAHVFFNLPLAARLILQGWQSIPAERFRLAASLDMGPAAIQRHIELPMLCRVVPGALLIIFVICTTSFAVALTLGGGPRATTVELAIYQAVRFEFDLGRAALLSVIQILITGVAAVAALRLAGEAGFGRGLDRQVARWDAGRFRYRAGDCLAIGAAALFLLVPVLAVVLRGVAELAALPAAVWLAAIRSVIVALASTAMVAGMALLMGLAAVRLGPRGRLIETSGLLAIAASPLVLGTGLFILTDPFVDSASLALPVTAFVNAILALPFALRALIPAMQETEAGFGRLADSLDLQGWARMRLLILPRVRAPLGFAAGLAAALSMGDLGVIALFADAETATLPLQVYRLMGAYRMDQAAGAAVLLLLLSFAMFRVLDAWGRGHAES